MTIIFILNRIFVYNCLLFEDRNKWSKLYDIWSSLLLKPYFALFEESKIRKE